MTTDRSATSTALVWCGVIALFITAFYVLVYPVKSLRVPLGSDTPVYVYWARRAAALGLRSPATGGRPVTVGILASLAATLRIPVAGVASAIGPALAITLALAVAALLDLSVGRSRLLFVVAGLLTGVFVAAMVSGYFATLTFGVLFVAGVACIAGNFGRTDRMPTAAAALLVATAGLAHPRFLLLALVVLIGSIVWLLPGSSRIRPPEARATWRPATRVALVGITGAAAAGLSLFGGGWASGVLLDTSRDTVLPRLGLSPLVRSSFKHVLSDAFPWYRALAAVGTAVLGMVVLAVVPRRESAGVPDQPRGANSLMEVAAADRVRLLWGVLITWLVITVGAIAALLLGFRAPGHRLAAFCLPLPMVTAMGLVAVRHRWRTRPGLGAVVVASSVVLYTLAFLPGLAGQNPFAAPSAITQSRAAGRLLADQPPRTQLILVADDRGRNPSLPLIRSLNYLRQQVPPGRLLDVHLFPGTPADLIARRPTLTGRIEHDRLTTEYWPGIQKALGRRPVAVVLEAFDRLRYREAHQHRPSGAQAAAFNPAPGLIVLPGFTGSPPVHGLPAALTEIGSGPFSPWLPLLLTPLVVVAFTGIGWGWARLALPSSDPVNRLALAPAFGIAAFGVASMIVDLSGLRLSPWGGSAALLLALAGPAAALWRARITITSPS